MSERKEERAAAAALVALGFVLVAAALVPVVLTVTQSGFGLNRPTIVLVLAAIALGGVFALWLKKGAAVSASAEPPHSLRERAGGGFWKQLHWLYKQDYPGELIGFGLVLLGMLFAILYVEYVEPLFR